MRPTRPTIHAPRHRAIAPRPWDIAAIAAYALGLSLSLVVCPNTLRAQGGGGSSNTPAIAATGATSGFANDNSPGSGFPLASDRTEVAPAAQPSWTADRGLPDASQLRPRFSQPGEVVTASATAPAEMSPEMSSTSATAFTETSGGVQHIPLAPPSKRLTGDQPKAASGTLQMVVSIISSLLLVVGLFLGIAWCYRKTLGTSLAGGLPKQVVNILGRTSISARQQLVLVRFGSKLLLVSVIQGEARTLGEISDPLEVDQMLGLCESGQPGSISQSFKSLLHSEGV